MKLACSICNVPTDGLWLDRALCDGCLDEMAEEMTSDYIVATPGEVAKYIAQAREELAEQYHDWSEERKSNP